MGAGGVMAAQTISLDPSMCRNDRLFAHDFGEDGEVDVGLLTRQFAGRNYFVVVPPSYRPGREHPLLMALHGTGGSAPGAVSNALDVAQTWQSIARNSGMVVVVPIGSSPSGSWQASADLPYLDLLRAHATSQYRIDSRRHYLWGFSSGGHFGHGVVLQRTDQYAAYAVAAGVLRGYACNATLCPGYLAAVPRRIPLDISSGTSDPIVPISEISADEGRFRDAGWVPGVDLWVRGLFDQGHEYTVQQLSDSWNNICRFGVIP